MQVVDQIELRDDLKAFRRQLDHLDKEGLDKVRAGHTAYITLAQRHLQFGRGWLGKALGCLVGDEFPYKESYQADNSLVAPTADVAKDEDGSEIYTDEHDNAVKRVKQLRNIVARAYKQAGKLRDRVVPHYQMPEAKENAGLTCHECLSHAMFHLHELSMSLGFEVQDMLEEGRGGAKPTEKKSSPGPGQNGAPLTGQPSKSGTAPEASTTTTGSSSASLSLGKPSHPFKHITDPRKHYLLSVSELRTKQSYEEALRLLAFFTDPVDEYNPIINELGSKFWNIPLVQITHLGNMINKFENDHGHRPEGADALGKSIGLNSDENSTGQTESGATGEQPSSTPTEDSSLTTPPPSEAPLFSNEEWDKLNGRNESDSNTAPAPEQSLESSEAPATEQPEEASTGQTTAATSDSNQPPTENSSSKTFQYLDMGEPLPLVTGTDLEESSPYNRPSKETASSRALKEHLQEYPKTITEVVHQEHQNPETPATIISETPAPNSTDSSSDVDSSTAAEETTSTALSATEQATTTSPEASPLTASTTSSDSKPPKAPKKGRKG